MSSKSILLTTIPHNAVVFASQDISNAVSWGIVKVGSDILYHGKWINNKFIGNVIVVSTSQSKILAVYDIQNGKASEIIDISKIVDATYCFQDGYEWNGQTYDSLPCGFGVITHNDEVLYSGFRLVNVDVCYGIYYQQGQEIYEGMVYMGKRHGEALLSSNPQLHWIDNSCDLPEVLFHTRGQDTTIHSYISSLTIDNNWYWKVSNFWIFGFPLIKTCVIGDNAFKGKSPGSCVFANLPELRSLRIGSYSFDHTNSLIINSFLLIFSTIDLPSLQQLVIGRESFCRATHINIICIQGSSYSQ